MTLPWVDPASEDDPRAVAAEPGREVKATSRSSDPVLADKPVLEWTKEDWARWIDDSSHTPAAEAEPVDVAEVTDEVANEAVGAAEAQTGAAVESDERPWNLESGFPIVDIGLPDEENAGSLVDPDPLWDEPPVRAVNLEAPRAETPTRAEAPAPAIANPTPGAPAANELAPPPLVGPRSEPLTTWGPPAGASPIAVPPTDARRVVDAPRTIGAPRPVDAAKARHTATPFAAPSQPSRSTLERSHRIRSALGLLGVAVTVGVVMAGLITVTIFAIGVALRRAVG